MWSEVYRYKRVSLPLPQLLAPGCGSCVKSDLLPHALHPWWVASPHTLSPDKPPFPKLLLIRYSITSHKENNQYVTERLNAAMDPSSPPSKLAWEETVWGPGSGSLFYREHPPTRVSLLLTLWNEVAIYKFTLQNYTSELQSNHSCPRMF